MNSYPLVSVIITTKNEEKHIADCLDSVKNQSYPRESIEIIVVDNNSTDKTKNIASHYTRFVYTKGPERSAQRNYGARKCRGKYYLYLDADMILSDHVIEECVTKLEKQKDTVALYVPEIIMGESFWCKVRRFERAFYTATVIDCVRCIRTDVFHKVGGFDESMSGPEDWDLDKKIRNTGKVDTILSPVFHNESQFTIAKYVSKKGYYATSFNKYITKWGKNDSDIKKQLGFYYRFIGVFIENGRWKNLIAHPVLTVGMYVLRILVGIKYMQVRNSHNGFKKN